MLSSDLHTDRQQRQLSELVAADAVRCSSASPASLCCNLCPCVRSLLALGALL